MASRIAGAVFTLLLAALLSLQIPSVQNRLTGRLVEKAKSVIEGSISFSDIELLPFRTLVIHDLVIIDRNPYIDSSGRYSPVDTFFHAKQVSASFSIRSLFHRKGVHFYRATVRDGGMHLVVEPDSVYPANLTRIFGIQPLTDRSVKEQGRIFDIQRVEVDNFRYRMNIYGHPEYYRGVGINYYDLDVTTNVRGHSMRMENGIMYAVCDRCELWEKSGYTAVISARCRVGRGKSLIEDIHLVDPWSDFRLKFYSMGYDHDPDFADFINEIMLEGEFEPEGRLAFKSLSYFGAPFENNAITPLVHSGRMRGYLRDFRVDDFVFDDLYSGLSGRLDCRLTGLPDPDELCLQVNGTDLRFDSSELSNFISAWAGGAGGPELSGISPGTEFTLNANVRGPINALNVKALLRGDVGALDASVRVDGISDPRGRISIYGNASAQELDLGRVIPGLPVGKSSFDAGLRAAMGADTTGISADSLHIESVEFRGRTIKGIDAKGRYSGDAAFVNVVSTDPEASLRLTATAGFDPEGKLSSIVAGGKLERLSSEFFIRDSASVKAVSGSIGADLKFSRNGGIRGKAKASSVSLHCKDSVFRLGDARIGADYTSGRQRINVKSDIFDASYMGSRPIGDFVNDVKAVTLGANFPALLEEPCECDSCGNYRLRVELHHISSLLPALGSSISVADSTLIVSETGSDGTMDSELISPRISFGNNVAYRVDVSLDNVEGGLNAFVMADRIRVAGLDIDRVAVNAFGTDNQFQANMQFQDSEEYFGKVNADGRFERAPLSGELSLYLMPKSSEIFISGENWKTSESLLSFGKDGIGIRGFRICSGDKYLVADGGVSKTRKDTLDVAINNFNINFIDRILKKDYGLSGGISGNASLSSGGENGNEINASLNVRDIKAGGVDGGDLDMEAIWDNNEMKYRTKILNTIGGRHALDIKADIYPFESRIEADAGFDKFNLALLSPFLKQIFSETGGSLSGSIKASGPIQDPDIRSDGTTLDNALVRIAFTKVPYYINGPFSVSGQKLIFDSLGVRDDSDGSASLSGTLDFSEFGNMSLDASMAFRRLKIFNSTAKDNPDIYGLLKASGSVGISGPLNGLKINGQIASSGQGDIHVPLNSSLIGTSSDILTFVEKLKYRPGGDFDGIAAPQRRSGGLAADIDLRVTQDVTAWLEIDRMAGNAMRFNGNGDVDIILDPRQNGLDVNGLYSINNGNYHFVLPGIIEKDFNIQTGSTIRFNGAIPDSELDITAIHPVKTSLSTLLTDSTTVASRRLVECEIDIDGKIKNLGFGFNVNVSDLDPSTKSRVESALNTDQKMQRQFVALLLLGTFLPGEETGIINGSTMLYSNIGEIMSGQLNSILQKFNIPLDFGFGYQQSYTGTDMYDVAISTQLFDNRVIVNGSVGNKRYESGNGFAGDIDVEVKLDKSGRFRLNAFSHSADQYTSFLDNSQRSGVGFSYQKEFDSFREFFKNLFRRRRDATLPGAGDEMVTIQVKP